MPLDPDLITQGQRAHDQVAAFISLRRRGLVYYYGVVTLAQLISATVALFMFKNEHLAISLFAAACIWATLSYFHWHRLKDLYAANLKFLDKLYLEHNRDDFPWVKEAVQMAAIRQIQDDLEREALGAVQK
jgi:hypothetical protein